jgi:amino acid transporter
MTLDPASIPADRQPSLRRVLTLGDLVWYGIVLIQPIAAVPLFGIADQLSQGHIVTTILIAMVAMMFTAVSYGAMANVYPTAGSAYTYVGRGLNLHLGFLTGWVMLLDYLIIPIINTIFGALTLNRILPSVPFMVWVALFVVIITALNLLGVQTTARTNQILLAAMSLVIGIFFVMAISYVGRRFGVHALFSTVPFYNPRTFHLHAVATATSLAALTYIGFDGITTLTEEARNPKRDIMRATVLVCLLTGILSGLQVYLAQLVWPDYLTFPDANTAFMDVALRTGGKFLFDGFAFILILASLGSGLAGQAGAARLLFGMGRDGALSSAFFGYVGRKRRVPSYNILLIGLCAFLGALVLSFERAAELLNFGAFLAFIGVNVVAMRHFHSLRRWGAALMSGFGAIFCICIWWSLPTPAKVGGSVWLCLGVIYLAILTRGFRQDPVAINSIDQSSPGEESANPRL